MYSIFDLIDIYSLNDEQEYELYHFLNNLDNEEETETEEEEDLTKELYWL